MLSWVEDQLRRRGYHSAMLPPHNRRQELLSRIDYLINQGGGEPEYRKMKAGWRRYKSDQRRGLVGVQVKLDARTKQRLFSLAKRTTIHKTISCLVNEKFQYIKDRKQAIQAATQRYICEQENSAIAQLERSKSELVKLKSNKHHLEAKICALHKELANLLLLLTEYEAATGSLVGANLNLSSEEKMEALKRRDELLNYYRNRVEALASLAIR